MHIIIQYIKVTLVGKANTNMIISTSKRIYIDTNLDNIVEPTETKSDIKPELIVSEPV